MSISLRELKARVNAAEHFEFAGYEGATIVMRRKVSALGGCLEWIRKQTPLSQVVIWLGAVAFACICSVVGLITGVAVSAAITVLLPHAG